jgi:hypothetical protein
MCAPSAGWSQATADGLTLEIARQDSAAFAAFNAGDVEGFMEFFSVDLEFFHDADGVSGYAELSAASRRLASSDNGLRRRMLPESLEVYPVPGYGAIQIARHEFCHWENDAQDCGVFGFTHVWQRRDDRWVMTRVLSYGH